MKILDILNSPWAILPERLAEICEIYNTHLRGEKIDLEAAAIRIGRPLENEREPYEVIGGTAVVPIHGVIAKRMNLFSQISGGVSTQLLAKDFQAAMDDNSVHSIVLSIDSPGGTVDGTQELAQTIHEARGRKPIVAHADGVMGSAAYWIGSAADSVYSAGDTTAVGSIGVVGQHVDYSEMEKNRGIKVTDITAGKYKRIASEHAPLSNEGKQYLQDHVDHIYKVFVDDVAKHRNVSPDKVLDGMADGKIFLGKQAVNAGLVDGVSTMGALVGSLNTKRFDQRKGAVAQYLTERRLSL